MLENTAFAPEVVEEFPAELLNIEVTDDKPFNKCLTCEYFRHGCSGPNLCAATIERACEFLQLCRAQLGLTYQQTADKAGLGISTVKHILNNDSKNPGAVSIWALNDTLAKDPSGKHPCAISIVNREMQKVNDECRRLQGVIDGIEEQHKQELSNVRADDKAKIDFLREQIKFKEAQMLAKDKLLDERADYMRRKDKYIAILATVLGVLLFVIIAALIVDKLDSGVGFFWLEEAVNRFSHTPTDTSAVILSNTFITEGIGYSVL